MSSTNTASSRRCCVLGDVAAAMTGAIRTWIAASLTTARVYILWQTVVETMWYTHEESETRQRQASSLEIQKGCYKEVLPKVCSITRDVANRGAWQSSSEPQLSLTTTAASLVYWNRCHDEQSNMQITFSLFSACRLCSNVCSLPIMYCI